MWVVDKQSKPDKSLGVNLPKHVAIIMDGNGRWAKKRHLPRIAGHREGLKTVRRIVKACGEKGIKILTLFAFSSENWRRPPDEVSSLLSLFLTALQNEIKKLHENNVKLRIIGDRQRFVTELQDSIEAAEKLTANNTGLTLVIAADYGGRWDIVEAMKAIAIKIQAGQLAPESITETTLHDYLTLSDLPEPDLFIRTSGEQRISNFLLWQLAYTELYFSPVLWPDFNETALEIALDFYTNRERRFGCTAEQIEEQLNHA
jgi:undecaprenyl diphosphate synthase